MELSIKITEETFQDAFQKAMSNVETETGLTVAECVEKQVTKKPDIEGDGYDPEGNLIYDTWICPCCNTYYEMEYEKYKHCPECGQKIDWSDETDG